MTDFAILVPRVRDRDLFSFGLKAAKIVGASEFTVSEFGAAERTQIPVDEQPQIARHLKRSDLYTLYNLNIAVPGFKLGLSRNPANDADIAFDRLTISNAGSGRQGSQEPLHSSKIYALNRLINEAFPVSPDRVSGLFHNSKAFTQLMTSHQRMVEQMQQTVANVGEQAAEARLGLEQEYTKRTSTLEAEFVERQSQADLDRQRLLDEIEQREADLRKRQKELDDRDNTHARRDLHKMLKARIAERAGKFEITPETKRTRLPIHVGVWGAGIALAALVAYYSTAFTDLPPSAAMSVIVATAVKPLGLTIALLGLIAWYLRWMNRWFERYADAEFYLKQFELDIDRANWVVETALEWKEVQEKTIPATLLESMSRSLFAKSDRDEEADMHPADYLASAILGRASGVTLKVPGGELSLTGKDIKNLQKDGMNV